MTDFFRHGILCLFTINLTGCLDEQISPLPLDPMETNNLIKEVIGEVNNSYVDEIEQEKLELGAINGLLSSLDEYSVYIPQSEYDSFNTATRGTFLGIGIEMKQGKNSLEIAAVIDETPAFKAGLKAGDVISKIDGKDISNMSKKEIVSKLSSDSASKVNLYITRGTSENFEVLIKKSIIQLQTVKCDFISNIALIKISYFNELTVNNLNQALKKVIKNQSLGLILDLRNNPGGILEQSIGVCDLFLSNKKIIEFKSKNPDDSKIIYSTRDDILNGLPMVVLIDSKSASGAELVAAALGDNKRAILLGQKTYGKGSLQTVIPIPGRGAIKLTTSYFISPNGNTINNTGVLPDIDISNELSESEKSENNADTAEDPLIKRATDLLQGLTALQN